MNSRGWLIATTMLVLVLAALHGISGTDSGVTDPGVTVEACESLPDYDYERLVVRVEEIKGMELERNVSICVEQTAGGIDTTPNRGRFAYVGKPGLSFFGLDAATNSGQRSSLGYTEFSPDGGAIEIFLANESVVENVPWISYEALLVHELSHAVELPPPTASNASTDGRMVGPRTTDELLARQAVSNGVAMYVADFYVERYGGHLNVSALDVGHQNWKRRVSQSVYHAGFLYSEQTDWRTVPGPGRVNSTAQLLHPGETTNATGFPLRPKLSMDSLNHVRTDRVGELFLRETFESRGVDAERAAAAAGGWTNDRMDYYRANGSSVVTWHVTWQNASERAEFVETYDEGYDYERVDALRDVDCRAPGRYLITADKSVTVVACTS
ncbi:hypothetical protein [Halorussus litoreus]|uniref:hypothetical protein n=1 Tax=Halorussus litoreus TaxID=1710536 RepID=UPI0013002ACB|nr:hypothetical protein [Halorussus litoreus]